MSIWELFLTAVALSMDAMAVAVSAGLSNAGGKGVKFREAGLMGLFSGVFRQVIASFGVLYHTAACNDIRQRRYALC